MLERYFKILNGKAKAKFLIAKKRGIMDKKIKQADSALESCMLCERKCRVNRLKGERGFCGVGAEPRIFGSQTHWGEEQELTPSATLFFSGCTMKCCYCFLPDTTVPTEKGILSLEEIYELGTKTDENSVISEIKSDIKTPTHKGKFQKIKNIFRHPHIGEIVVITPFFFPQVKCTPEHQFFIWNRETRQIEKKEARTITNEDFLVIPKVRNSQDFKQIDCLQVLSEIKTNGYKKSIKKLRKEDIARVVVLHESGLSTRKISKQTGFSPTFIGYLIKKNMEQHDFFFEQHKIVEKNGFVRFTGGKCKIPRFIPIDNKLCRLLGYYCSEGSIYKDKTRPNSYRLSFSFGNKENKLIQDTYDIIEEIFRIKPTIVKTKTTTRVDVINSSCALLFKELCASGAANKKIPNFLFKSKKEAVENFLTAYISGDGCITKDRQGQMISTNTVSKKLALGIFWLFLMSGKIPRFFIYQPKPTKVLENRVINQSTLYYVKVRKENLNIMENESYWFIPIRNISREKHTGYVYNIEVEGEHSYLANFIAVKNCQNAPQSMNNEGEQWSAEKTARWIEKKRMEGCRNVNFVGGDPAPNIPFILKVLKKTKVNIPVVFNSNAYFSEAAAELLKDIIDVYLLDFRYFDASCAEELSKAPGYPDAAKRNLLFAEKHGELMVRLLVLPGHIECDAKPALEWISRNLESYKLNIMPQYKPCWHAYELPELGRRISIAEYNEVVGYAHAVGIEI